MCDKRGTVRTGQFAPYQIKLDGHDSLIFAPQVQSPETLNPKP
jgi:hypothetical protein